MVPSATCDPAAWAAAVTSPMGAHNRGGAGSEAQRATCQQPARHVQVVTSAAPTDALEYGHNRQYLAIHIPSAESLEQGRNRSRELLFYMEQPR